MDADPAAALGARHPLVEVLRACRSTRERMLAIAMVQAAGAALLLSATQLGIAIVIAASVVQLALGVRLLVLLETRRELAWELIVEGRAPRRLAALEHERRRLADPRRRAQLARTLEQLADMAERRGSHVAGARPYFDVRVVRAVAPELRELGAFLRADDCDVRGVALLQSLQTCGGSPLYRDATQPLREQLRRARYLLLLESKRPVGQEPPGWAQSRVTASSSSVRIGPW